MVINWRAPKDFDNLLYYQMTLFFIIAFLLMSFKDGQSTIYYIDNVPKPSGFSQNYVNERLYLTNYSNLSSLSSPKSLGSIMGYEQDLIKQNYKIPYINLFIFWVLSPLLNYIYLIWFFFFKKKDLNT